MNEYEWTVDAIIELPPDVDYEAFFGVLNDAIDDVITRRGGKWGGTTQLAPYQGESNGEEEEE